MTATMTRKSARPAPKATPKPAVPAAPRTCKWTSHEPAAALRRGDSAAMEVTSDRRVRRLQVRLVTAFGRVSAVLVVETHPRREAEYHKVIRLGDMWRCDDQEVADAAAAALRRIGIS